MTSVSPDHTTWGLDSPFMVGLQSCFALISQSHAHMDFSLSTINITLYAELQESSSLHNSERSER